MKSLTEFIYESAILESLQDPTLLQITSLDYASDTKINKYLKLLAFALDKISANNDMWDEYDLSSDSKLADYCNNVMRPISPGVDDDCKTFKKNIAVLYDDNDEVQLIFINWKAERYSTIYKGDDDKYHNYEWGRNPYDMKLFKEYGCTRAKVLILDDYPEFFTGKLRDTRWKAKENDWYAGELFGSKYFDVDWAKKNIERYKKTLATYDLKDDSRLKTYVDKVQDLTSEVLDIINNLGTNRINWEVSRLIKKVNDKSDLEKLLTNYQYYINKNKDKKRPDTATLVRNRTKLVKEIAAVTKEIEDYKKSH